MRMKRTGLSMAAAGALVLGFVTVSAGAPEEVANTYTGCLANGGAINKVAIGDEPANPCSQDQVEISWSEGVPAEDVAALDDRVTVLEGGATVLDGRVGDLESRSSAAFRSVDCAAGETVGDALAEVRDNLGPVSIGISGMCEENVSIDRDDVTLSGVERGDGIRSASEDSVVRIQDSARVKFENMTIIGGRAGIDGQPGSSFEVVSTTVKDSRWGIFAGGASAWLKDCVVQDSSGFGVYASGGSVLIDRCSLTGNRDGMLSTDSGSIRAFMVEVTGSERTGAFASSGASISFVDSTIADNGDVGIHVLFNGSASVQGSRIADNGTDGAGADLGSLIEVHGSVIERNGNSGLSASRASTVTVDTTTIRDNTFDGIALNDQSNGANPVDSGSVIRDNGGMGIRCAGPGGFPEVQNGFNLADIDFSGNVEGDTNCP